jgi:hypothetical protein
MTNAIILLMLFYMSIWLFFHWGERLAMTRIDTKVFLIIILTIWISIKNIT